MKEKKMKRYTRSQAIHKKCLECSESQKEVRKCTNTNCPLFRYRTGREDRDDLYQSSKRNSNFSEINSNRDYAHLNVKNGVNAV